MFPEAAAAARGTGLMAVIALIVVVAGLVVAIARSVDLGATNVSVDTLRQRALHVANSGMQLSINRAYAPNGTAACGVENWDLSTLPGFPDCRADVVCAASVAAGTTFYEFRAVGVCQAGNLTAQRRLFVRTR